MQNITQNIYITGAEQGSGKSVIMLAMMEMLSGHAHKIGFFRPLISANENRADENKDELIQLLTQRYKLQWPYESMYGCTDDEAHTLISAGRYEELLKKILAKYRSLQASCDHVLCVGTDYKTGDSIYEFDFNADVANNLGCLLMPVVQGGGRDNKQLLDAVASVSHDIKESDADLLAIVINGVAGSQVEQLRIHFNNSRQTSPVYIVPSEPSLEKPCMGDILRGLNARLISGSTESLNYEVHNYKVAAMLVPDFLDHLEKADLIITPGDRADIIVASLLAFHSSSYPQISGLLLTGKQEPAEQVKLLFNGLGELPFAVLGVSTDTFTSALNVTRIHAQLHAQNERKIATALGLVENNIDMQELKRRLISTKEPRLTPLMFEYDILQRAKSDPQHIVLPEGEEERILKAAEILLLRHGVSRLTLLGNVEKIQQKIKDLALQFEGIEIIDPADSTLREEFATCYYELRKHKGVAYEMAYDLIMDVSYFGTMMVHLGYADGMVSGSVHTTQHTIRPAFEIIKTRPGTSIVSSVFFMCLEDRVLVYGDCAVNPNPNAQQLADIAISSAQTASMFNISPRIAMLSYSTGESGKGEAVEKVRSATQLAKKLRPDLFLEGPMQYDAAIDSSVASTKLPGSQVAGQANVFIFPDLNTGNNTYKAVQRSSGAIAIGPVLQGLKKPVNDLSRGCSVTDIVNTVLITAIQAQVSNNSQTEKTNR